MKNVKIRQHYRYDCGAACLVSVAAFYGIRASIARTRLLCGCTPDGITIQGIIDGASRLGLDAKGYRSPGKEPSSISSIPVPAIAHTMDKDGLLHFIVVYRVGKDMLEVMDPAGGEMKKMKKSDFAAIWTGYIIAVTPSFTVKAADDGTASSAAALWELARANRKELALAAAGSMACTAAGISTTFLLQQTIDKVIPQGNAAAVIFLALLLFSLTFASLYIGYCTTRYLIRCSLKVETTLTCSYMEKLLRLPAGFFSSFQAGEISSRIEDIHHIRSFITGGTIGIFTSLITIIGALAVMYCYNTRLSIIITLALPAYYALYRIAGHMNRKYSRQVAASGAAFQTDLLELVSTQGCIRHYGAYRLAAGKMERSYVGMAESLNRCADAVNLFSTSVQGISRILLCIILTAGSAALLRGEMSIGELVGFYSLCSFFTVPVDDLIRTNEMIARTSVSCSRIFEILSLPDEDGAGYAGADRAGTTSAAISPDSLDGDIVVEGVHFRYPGREELLHGLSFTAPRGKITLLRGGSGCGKSTVASLILKDHTPGTGTIRYSGIDISRLNTSRWRSMIGYVPQRAALFNATILDNITLGEDEPDIGKVLEICGRLKMMDMAERFPQGLLTRAGSGGCSLSGGECQKIAMARAIYRNPRIYILDEATSSLDPESEKCVLEALVGLRDAGKTIIFISHKRDNGTIADNVVDIGREGCGHTPTGSGNLRST
ncbi:MAG: peptidase domain-containing ABC transporter [Bacteroidales bacterium]|nr:peptidase domain-containing ABC transporter [Bacteroidales bacterium]